MSDTVTLDAAGSPEANRILDGMLRALQDALRRPPVWDDGMRACVDQAFAAYDAWIAHVVVAHPMSCASGCTACCHDNPRGVSGVELRRLIEAIEASPGAGTVMWRFRSLAAQKADPETWRRRRVPCPLLVDGRCSQYAARPVACRAFHALTPAAWCDPADPHYPERINPHLDPPAVLIQALRVLSERLGLANAADLHGGIATLSG
jgi:Fe-S-cluster containining protein